jgi:hypothetical protein
LDPSELNTPKPRGATETPVQQTRRTSEQHPQSKVELALELIGIAGHAEHHRYAALRRQHADVLAASEPHAWRTHWAGAGVGQQVLVRGGEGEMRSRVNASSRAATSSRATASNRATISCRAMTSNKALAINSNRATAAAALRAFLTATAAVAHMEFREVVSACSEAEDSASVGAQGNRQRLGRKPGG